MLLEALDRPGDFWRSVDCTCPVAPTQSHPEIALGDMDVIYEQVDQLSRHTDWLVQVVAGQHLTNFVQSERFLMRLRSLREPESGQNVAARVSLLLGRQPK